uniref:uncharacterized protein LOC120325911 n=1 Tax=Styela clava TaxID=7725 RepID=UPI001939B535|nr:uncharacterized protein LOC120325911 [Styela clava]
MNHDIELPASVVTKYNLPTKMVRFCYVEKVADEQREKELKLAPKLTEKHIKPSKYQKMRVGLAAQVISHSTACAIKTLVESGVLPRDALSTSFFCSFFNKWFDIVNARSIDNALFPNSRKKLDHLIEVCSAKSLIRSSKLSLCNTSASILNRDKASSILVCLVS